MGLKSMHEASRPPREPESNLQLIEEQSRTISAQEQTISELSLQVSMLKSEVQKLADKNVKLNEADNVLKQNAELKKQNELLKQEKYRAEQEAEAKVGSVKREYAERVKELEHSQYEAEASRSEAEKLKQSLKADTEKRAKELVKAKVKSLEATYQAKTSSHYAYVTGVSLYAVLVTVLTAIRSETFVSDFKTFFEVIWGFLLRCFGWLENGANFVAQLGDKIPQEIVATIVHWLLWFIVLFGIGIGAVVLLLIGIAKLVSWYTENYTDNTSLGVALVSLALSIFFAEDIRAFVPINLLLLLIITHVLYVGVRWYIKGYRENRGY